MSPQQKPLNELWPERIDAKQELDPWVRLEPKLEKADGSALHRMVAAMLTGRALYLLAGFGVDPSLKLSGLTQMQSFIVQHDWAAAFKGATEFEAGDFQLPYPLSCFEFRINGRRVCATITEHNGQKQIIVLVETRNAWIIPIVPFTLKDGMWQPIVQGEDETCAALPPFLAGQIRAICISMEADVASVDTISADAKLNAAREKRGKLPLPDYHVIKLAHRELHGSGEAAEGERRKLRLHFKRGHWRRLSEERKVWVRWCLVGNPDLGFIEKQYSLGSGK